MKRILDNSDSRCDFKPNHGFSTYHTQHLMSKILVLKVDAHGAHVRGTKKLVD